MSTIDTRMTGQFKTFPVEGVGAVLRLVVLSCNNWGAGRYSKVHSAIGQLDPLPDLIIHLGDNGYPEFTEANMPLQIAQGIHFTNRKGPVRDLARLAPTFWMFQDHDGSCNEGNLTVFGEDAASMAAYQAILANTREIYNAMVPAYALRDSDSIAQTFVIGRWAFIGVDTQSQSNFGNRDRGLPPAADRYVIGSTQPDVFYNQLADIQTLATAYEADADIDTIVLMVPMGWHEPYYETGFNYYAPLEKTALEDWWASNITKQSFVFTGDLHAVGIDDGTVTDTSTGGNSGIICLMGSAALAGASPVVREYEFAGRDSLIIGNNRAFAVIDIAADNTWEVNFWGEPYDGTIPTLLGTFASSEL